MACLQNSVVSMDKCLEVRDCDDILTAMQMTRTIAEELGFSPEETLFLQLATEEACTNAYDHGAMKRTGYFEIQWTAHAATIQICVRQESRPFDIDLRALTELTERNDGLRGRGLILIAGLMDELGVVSHGTQVTFSMKKTRKPPSHER
ncbi:ATP-binding protein [Paenibacillus sp. MBLB4367]|uniref:ATP-binding protein n=1 Tax=Paenibacillus sp. MBLB4367 TaxID=3384767 RepID=UPI003907F3C2